MQIAGYTIKEKLYETARTAVYRSIREEDSVPVIIKTPRTDLPPAQDLARLKYEYDISSTLDLQGIVKPYNLLDFDNKLAMISEDFGGISLRQYIENNPMSPKDFLDVALKLAETLGEIHKNNIIHRDIKPQNIILNAKTGEVKITDFGTASVISRENQSINHSGVLEGTLTYVSPEQTGRMNRSIDYRTDFYSLGITFYEMLTGAPPFESDDAMELIHSHIARKPIAPRKTPTKSPKGLSDIIMKLLEKNPEKRYRSAHGLKFDLQECRIQLESRGSIGTLILGTNDITEKFEISSRLYGRENELKILKDNFEKVGQGETRLVMVESPTGTGKSTLIRELQKELIAEDGYFCTGKFDEFNQNTPYKAVLEAFGQLIGQILTENESKIQRWKMRINSALEPNAGLIVDVIPELELIIGPQPAPLELPLLEAQNRFKLVFNKFLKVLAAPEHPLVLFLDDMHWADPASLNLLRTLLEESNVKNILILGAFRELSQEPANLLHEFLAAVKSTSPAPTMLTLTPLDREDLNRLIADTLDRAIEDTLELSELVHNRTRGNPFFAGEFLRRLFNEKMLGFDRDKFSWIWDIEQIRLQDITENVIDLMRTKLIALPPNAQTILQYAACIGTEFDLEVLYEVDRREEQSIVQDLWEGIIEGLIEPIDAEFRENRENAENENLVPRYRFLHSQVRQAAYQMLPVERRREIHLVIGRRLLEEKNTDEQLFTILNHLNIAGSLIERTHERLTVAELNLKAGDRAKSSNAYESALEYLTAANSFLPKDTWVDEYETTWNINIGQAECEYLSGGAERAEILFEEILKYTAEEESVQVHNLRVQLYTSTARYVEALDEAGRALKILGVTLKKKSSKMALARALGRVQLRMIGRSVQDLKNLPPMQNKKIERIIMILLNVSPAAYLLDSDLMALYVLKNMNYTLKYGHSRFSPVTLGGYAIILGAGLGRYREADELSHIAMELSHELNPTDFARTSFIISGFTNHWVNHFRTDLKYLEDAYKASMETGNLLYAGYSAAVMTLVKYIKGENLLLVEAENKRRLSFLEKNNHQDMAALLITLRQVLLCLKGQTKSPTDLSDENFDEQKFLQGLKTNDLKNPGIWYSYLKMELLYIFGEYQDSDDLIAYGREVYSAGLGSLNSCGFLLYVGLHLLARGPAGGKKASVPREVRKIIAQYKNWSELNPDAFLARYYLLLAEAARFKGEYRDTVDYYDLAISAAQKSELYHFQAIINERAANFYFKSKRFKVAKPYLSDAHYLFEKWGAGARVAALNETYSELLVLGHEHESTTTTRSITNRTGAIPGGKRAEAGLLDLDTVIKATQSLSQEIELNNLLKKLVGILLENAGAQKGYVILHRDGEFFLEAEGRSDQEEVKILDSLPLVEAEAVPSSVINYVKRTRESLVLNDATTEDRFAEDPYIKKNKPYSVLCVPIIHKGALTGLLYLENAMARSAFTHDRFEVLKILSSQIAISIENAQLYDEQRAALELQKKMTSSFSRFVPQQFLTCLGKDNLVDVKLGEAVEQNMTILFSDIRRFTSISENMTANENFQFLNSYLKRMEPFLVKHGGFVDKFIGDAIMALFADGPKGAIQAAVDIIKELRIYNKHRARSGYEAIEIGLGINTGDVMLGTVGSPQRMETTVIGDTVNLASRLESMTKIYKVPVIFSDSVLGKLDDPEAFHFREIDSVRVRGKEIPVELFELYEGDPQEILEQKEKNHVPFYTAILHYKTGAFKDSLKLFQTCLDSCPEDHVAAAYIKRCTALIENPPGPNWKGVSKIR